jgi:hypothetical protein
MGYAGATEKGRNLHACKGHSMHAGRQPVKTLDGVPENSAGGDALQRVLWRRGACISQPMHARSPNGFRGRSPENSAMGVVMRCRAYSGGVLRPYTRQLQRRGASQAPQHHPPQSYFYNSRAHAVVTLGMT